MEFLSMKCWKMYAFLISIMLLSLTVIVRLHAEENNAAAKQEVAQEFIEMAQDFEKKNQIEDAIEIYQRITNAFPEDLESQTQLAKLYTRTKQHENAAEIWSKLLETEPNNTDYQDKYFESLQEAGKYENALELAQTYIQTEPEVGIHYTRLAKLQTTQGKDDDAITNYEKAIEFGHADKETYLKLAELYFIIDDMEATEKALKNAILHIRSEWDRERIDKQLINLYRYQDNLAQRLQQADDDTITFQLQKELARHLLENNEFEKSVDSYKKALEMTNSSDERKKVVAELLNAYIKQDRTDLILEFYETEISKQPRLTRFMTSFGYPYITIAFRGDNEREALINTYKNQGILVELKSLFESKLEESDKNPNVIEMLAKIFWEDNNYKKAAETYHLLSKIEPNNIHSFYFAAAAYHKSNQPNRVEAVLKQAETALMSSDKRMDASFLGALATICLRNEMYETATKLANDAVTEVEKSDETWVYEYYYEILANCYVKTKRYEMAYETYQKMAKNDEGTYIEEKAKTEMDRIAKTANLYQKWIPEQLKKVQDNPNNIEFILELAESYKASDKIEDAITQYERLAELDPDNPKWYITLGNLYQKTMPERRETGKVIKGTALSLSGNRSYVEIYNSVTLDNITEHVTVSAWIKPTDYPNRYSPIVYRGDERVPDIKNRSYILHLKEGGFIQFAASPGGAGEAGLYSPSNVIQLNRWHHIAAVIDAKNNSMQLFIDGVNVANRNFRGKKFLYNSLLPLRIGWTHEENRETHSSFIGQIDEVRVWNLPRTESEIRSDMNKQLNGNEPGLVGYWKFDAQTNGIVTDSTPNKNDGKLVGDAKLEPYSRPIFEDTRSEQISRSIAAYKIAIGLEPSSYQPYNLIAQTYIKTGKKTQAEETYLQALDAPLKQSDLDSAVYAISKIYADGQDNIHIALLEQIKPRMGNSAFLYEKLGDLYKKAGEIEKAESAYAKWLNIRKTVLNRQQSASQYRRFVDELIDKELFSDTALKLAKRAFQKTTDSDHAYSATLAHAYVVNGLYDEAFKLYKLSISSISREYAMDNLLQEIIELAKKANDKERYYNMLDKLTSSIPPDLSVSNANVFKTNVKLGLAEYYSKNNMHDKASELVRQTGIIPENVWLTLGPFDNTAGIGYNTEYIAEDTTQIDPTTVYEGIDGRIGWKKHSDADFDGFIDLGKDINWSVSYAWITITSLEEREVQLRFGSDTHSKIYLNGEEIFANTQMKSAVVDNDIIPVKLKQGNNSILVKVCNQKLGLGFYLRITDTNGNRIEGLRINKQ